MVGSAILATTKGKIAVAAVLAVVAGGAAAAGFGVLPGFGGSDPVNAAPSGSDAVVHVDLSVRDDEVTRTLVNEMLADNGPYGPQNQSDAESTIRDETGLNPEELSDVVSFSKYPPEGADVGVEQYSAVVLSSTWSESEFVAEYENSSGALTETTYEGKALYEPETAPSYGTPTHVGVLGDGTFVVGSPTAVRDAIDVEVGNADSLDGALRDRFDATRDGYVRFAATVPSERIPAETAAQAGPIDASATRELTHVAGTYYTMDTKAGLSLRLRADSTDSARDVADMTDGAVSFARGSASNESVKSTLRNVDVTREEQTVTVTYEDGPSAISVVLEEFLGY